MLSGLCKLNGPTFSKGTFRLTVVDSDRNIFIDDLKKGDRMAVMIQGNASRFARFSRSKAGRFAYIASRIR